MSELKDKVYKSIKRLKNFVPDEGYYLAFSGGKDSVCCKALLDMAGIKYDATYRVTTVDPPELVRFIKEKRRAAEAEERAAQEKAKLAEKIAAMNEEQLAAFNKALDEPKKEYVPVYFPTPAYNPPVMVPYCGQRLLF